LATSSTGPTSFGVRFINQTAQTLNFIQAHLTGELWRQSDLSKTLDCYYFIDPTGTAAIPTGQTASLPSLTVALPVNPAAVGGSPVDGTVAINQTNLDAANLAIANWRPGAALWLVWQMTDPAGKAQGLAIDNFSFSASSGAIPAPVPISFQATQTNLVLSWTGLVGQSYQVEYKDDLTPGAWTPTGNPLVGTGAVLTFTADFTESSQRFYRLTVLP
jgi:hypothetical protein